MRPSTPSDFQHCSSTELPAASTISRWNAMSCWASAFMSPRRAAARIASTSRSSTVDVAVELFAASFAASSSSTARTG